ncbi:MAG: DNA polymerase I, partial [Clostridia bacterium]
SFAFDKNLGYTVAIAENLFSEGVTYDDFIDLLKQLIVNKKICLYDIKSTLHSMKNYSLDLSNAEYDLMLMHYLVDFDSSISTLSATLSAYNLTNMNPACGMIRLLETFETELSNQEMTKLYFEIERPLVNVLYEMECEGFKVDQSEIDVLRKTYQDEIDSLSKQIHILAEDDTFNINSPKQLGAILFDKLKLPAAKKNRNGYSTDASTLEKLVDKHDIVKYVLRYRQIMKLLSTYIDGLSSQINVESGKIHTIFNQALTVTGRLSSKEPNLQNIPVRSPEGRVLRKLFIPSSSDNLLVSADYSQIELRLLAHFSRDKALIEAYENGEDIHRFTASQVFNVSLNEVTSEMRSASKAVNFGIIYGISDFGLAQQIGVSVKTAKAYIERYFEKYPTVKAYMNSNVEFCKINGYVTTITGRRRKIREINSQNFMQRSFGERAAMNMPLQGSSADIIKIAMIHVFERLKKEGLESKLILQIHDELLIDAKKSEKDKVIKILKEEMETAVALNVPLPVNVSVGESWYEAK